ncbi:beta 1-4 rhamnosyltransferase Cps2T [Robertmurraya sp. P23]|uniref:beta 1-4 rhamnosyltransferase Cps2T n=1 Tax=Robertmurraya sp. P23 TaxID=3436931 RepID=UPI003D98EB98
MKNIFIIGSKGIPSRYGGFETFVEKLTEYKKSKNIQYHVACLSESKEKETIHNDARCFNVNTSISGPAKAIEYDVRSLNEVYSYIVANKVENPIVYILACRIGPFMQYFKRKFDKINVPVYVNPDGHEWKRAKWSLPVRKYWKLSERLMIKSTDMAICDSKAIEDYIQKEYSSYHPKTAFIAYGADVKIPPKESILKLNEWLKKWGLEKQDYYLIVGRFVPENNYDLMIREFVKSNTTKKLVIVTNLEKNKFYEELKEKTNFDKDERVKFVGTIYDEELLFQVRTNAFAYLHGHEVGGTNPSLLEALSTTSLNLLLDVQFNKEVGVDASLYFSKKPNNLVNLINKLDGYTTQMIEEMGIKAKQRIKEAYTWDIIVNSYEKLFEGKHEK